MRLHHFETPSPHTEFGAKGMGEGGAIAPAVLFNAVNDALRPLGAAELLRTPLSPTRVLAAIAQGSRQSASRQRGGDGMKAAAFEHASGSLQEALRALRAYEAAPSSWPAGNRWDRC